MEKNKSQRERNNAKKSRNMRNRSSEHIAVVAIAINGYNQLIDVTPDKRDF